MKKILLTFIVVAMLPVMLSAQQANGKNKKAFAELFLTLAENNTSVYVDRIKVMPEGGDYRLAKALAEVYIYKLTGSDDTLEFVSSDFKALANKEKPAELKFKQAGVGKDFSWMKISSTNFGVKRFYWTITNINYIFPKNEFPAEYKDKMLKVHITFPRKTVVAANTGMPDEDETNKTNETFTWELNFSELSNNYKFIAHYFSEDKDDSPPDEEPFISLYMTYSKHTSLQLKTISIPVEDYRISKLAADLYMYKLTKMENTLTPVGNYKAAQKEDRNLTFTVDEKAANKIDWSMILNNESDDERFALNINNLSSLFRDTQDLSTFSNKTIAIKVKYEDDTCGSANSDEPIIESGIYVWKFMLKELLETEEKPHPKIENKTIKEGEKLLVYYY